MRAHFAESTVEDAALERLEELGYEIRNGVELIESGERAAPSQVILADRLRSAPTNINRTLPPAAVDEAIRRLGASERRRVTRSWLIASTQNGYDRTQNGY
jgi:type I restriction enzyme R subunit